MIRLFISDFDGTLLNEHHTISEETEKAILALRNSGVSFMPASGRDYLMIMNEMDKVHLTPKCIALNGGALYDNDGTMLISNPIGKKALIEIVNLLDGYDEIEVVYFAEDGRNIHASEDTKDAFFENRKKNHPFFKTMDEESANAFFDKMKNITIFEAEMEKIIAKTITKLDLVFRNLNLRDEVMERLQWIDDIAVTSSISHNIEINSKYATKGHMAKKVCKFYGYDEDEVAVIGDNINDISMLSMFKNSYAMGQASEEVKKHAHYIADTNANDGVAKVMYEIIEKNAKEQ